MHQIFFASDFRATISSQPVTGHDAWTNNCRNTGFREVTDPGSFGFQPAFKYYYNMNCYWYIYNPYPITLKINYNSFSVSQSFTSF